MKRFSIIGACDGYDTYEGMLVGVLVKNVSRLLRTTSLLVVEPFM